MAGLPNYGDNKVTSGNMGQVGDKSMEVALATKMQLVLDQPMADVESGLCNRDFEGDFFKIGDSVALVKPDINSLAIEFGEIGDPQVVTGAAGHAGKPGYINKDARLTPSNIEFSKQILTIDKFTKYAFYISDLTEAEGKWNYESGNLDAVAQEIRKRHNLETCQMVVDAGVAGEIETLGTDPENPIVVTTGDELYEKVIVPIYGHLYDRGAITADGQVTYGSNSQQAKSTFGQLFVPTPAYTRLLVSNKYLTERSTAVADEVVKTGKVRTVMNLDISIEPSLNPNADRPIRLATEEGEPITDVVAIIAGTRNLITKAGKVLAPDKFRSHRFFADEYHGMEIYGKQIVEPKAGVVVFVKLA